MYYRDKVTPELMAKFHAPMKSLQGRKAFLHFAHSLDNNDLVSIEEDIRRFEIPVHIIRGERDVYLSGAIAQKLHGDIKGSRLTLIDTGGHFIQEDEPAMVADAILAFLEGECE